MGAAPTAEADIAARGDVVDGKENPLVSRLNGWRRFLLDVAKEYGMTPRAEASLSVERAQAARDGVDLEAIRERGRQVIDAREAAGE